MTYAPTNPDVVPVRPRTVACSAAVANPYVQCRCWAEWKIKGQWAKYCPRHAAERGMVIPTLTPSPKEQTMYTTRNFKTKAALRLAVTNGLRVEIYNPGEDVTGIAAPTNGLTTIEGPHYPEPHRWYARVEVLDGRVVRVLA